MRTVLAAVLAVVLPVGADITEPRSGATFPGAVDGMTLTGVGLRTRTFLQVKVYAIGLYVSDAALAGHLAPHRGQPATEALYQELIWGDFPKQVTLELVRDVSAAQMRESFREVLSRADPKHVETLSSYLGDFRAGQEFAVRWLPGGALEVTIAGQRKPPIVDKDFAAAVFAIWLGRHPIQEDVKQGLVRGLVAPRP